MAGYKGIDYSIKWTPKEEGILLNRIQMGKTNKEIGKELGKTEACVEAKKKRMKLYSREIQVVRRGEALEEQIKLAAEYNKATQTRKEIAKVEKKLVNKETKWLRFTDGMKDAIKAIKEPSKIKLHIQKESKEQEEAVLMISDSHCGEVVKSEQIGGINEYNFKIAEGRFNNLVNITGDLLLNKLRGYHIKKLHIAILGDMVSGSIHSELRKNAEFSEHVVIEKTAKILAITISELSKLVPEVVVYCFVGNHGRITTEYTYKDRSEDSLEYGVYSQLELHLKGHKSVKVHRSKSAYEIIEINGHPILMTHGDMIKQATIKGIKNFLNELQHAHGFASVIIGHFHQSFSFAYGKGEVLCNGSLIGNNEFSTLSLGAFAIPKQWLFGVCKDRITWKYEIECDYRK